MKPYLVDVPVKVDIWIRPEAQRRQFEVIKQARPSILFLISDGGRNEKEWEAIYQNRKMFDEEIDWECTVYRLYKDENNGMYAMMQEKEKLIWEHVDRCMFLEDDYVPSVSFFRYCAELLEKYKDDERIMSICGMNHEGVSENVPDDYFFSQACSVWGMATWKRTIDQRNWYRNHRILDDYTKSLLKDATKNCRVFWKQFLGYQRNEVLHGHPQGGEYWCGFDLFSQNRLVIVPKYNMINNIGCTTDAAHAHSIELLPRGIRRVFNMRTYELEFPLKHPNYVMPDMRYKKRVDHIMGWVWYIKIFRAFESAFLALRYTGLSGFIKRTKKFFKRITGKTKEK